MGTQDDPRPRAAPNFAPQELAAEAVREAGMRRGVYLREHLAELAEVKIELR